MRNQISNIENQNCGCGSLKAEGFGDGDVGNTIVRIAIPKLRLRLPPTEELIIPKLLEYNSND
jgi:hypothetical protein